MSGYRMRLVAECTNPECSHRETIFRGWFSTLVMNRLFLERMVTAEQHECKPIRG